MKLLKIYHDSKKFFPTAWWEDDVNDYYLEGVWIGKEVRLRRYRRLVKGERLTGCQIVPWGKDAYDEELLYKSYRFDRPWNRESWVEVVNELPTRLAEELL